MAITFANNRWTHWRYVNTHMRYSMSYVVITLVVLLFLNIYTSGTTQQLFYQNKEASMIERCQLTASDIANLDILNPSTVDEAVSKMGSLRMTRMVITGLSGIVIYDSEKENSALGNYCLFPEVVHALQDQDVFSWNYHSGVMVSRAATPIYSYGTLIGCVYMMEYDTTQGALMESLQINILSITVILEVVVLLFSITSSNMFSRRFRKILTSMRIIREGDYTHKVDLSGNDELSYLGSEFNDLTERLQTSENRRRQFVSDASHELKTPLASIKLLSDSILQNEMDKETTREFVEDIGNEAERLNRMTQKLLSLTKIEYQPDSEFEIVYIKPAIEAVSRMLSGIADKNGVQVEYNLQQDSQILMQEDDLYQIIFNLAENGIKYNLPGGKLLITLKRENDNAILEISDTGVGIPADAVSHIFERFYRVDKARARKSGGSGLGLAIVRNMVERNNGSIEVSSVLGQGTIFTVTFPIFDTEEGPI